MHNLKKKFPVFDNNFSVRPSAGCAYFVRKLKFALLQDTYRVPMCWIVRNNNTYAPTIHVRLSSLDYPDQKKHS